MSTDGPDSSDKWRMASIRNAAPAAKRPVQPAAAPRAEDTSRGYPWAPLPRQYSFAGEPMPMPAQVRWANTLMTVVTVWFALGGLIGMARAA